MGEITPILDPQARPHLAARICQHSPSITKPQNTSLRRGWNASLRNAYSSNPKCEMRAFQVWMLRLIFKAFRETQGDLSSIVKSKVVGAIITEPFCWLLCHHLALLSKTVLMRSLMVALRSINQYINQHQKKTLNRCLKTHPKLDPKTPVRGDDIGGWY